MMYDVHIKIEFENEHDAADWNLEVICKESIGSSLLGASECVSCSYYIKEGNYVIVPRFKISKRNAERINDVSVINKYKSKLQNNIKKSTLLKVEPVNQGNKIAFEPR